jgi:hypothetical protein
VVRTYAALVRIRGRPLAVQKLHTASDTVGQAADAEVAARLCARWSRRLADAETAENAR